MRLVTYKEILRGVTDAMGWDRTTAGDPNLDSEEWHSAKRAISKSVSEIWNRMVTKDITRTEHRFYKPVYTSASIFAAGDFVYFAPAGEYYQALRDVTGVAPATLSDDTWSTNLNYWSLAEREVSGDTFDATETYEQGDVVYYAEDNQFYQLHTAATAGTLPTDTAYWGVITAFDAYVPWVQDGLLPMGKILGVWKEDPRKFKGARPVTWEESVHGVQIKDFSLNSVWVQYVLRPPRFTGDVFDAAEAYTPASEEGTSVVNFTSSMSAIYGIAGRTALAALASHANRQVVYLLYLITDGDARGGEFEYQSSNTTPHDGVDVIRPDNVDEADPGRWIRSGNVT